MLGAPLDYSDDALAEILSPRHFVNVRATYGGPAPAETADASAASRQLLDGDHAWLVRTTAALSDAERRLAARAAAL